MDILTVLLRLKCHVYQLQVTPTVMDKPDSYFIVIFIDLMLLPLPPLLSIVGKDLCVTQKEEKQTKKPETQIQTAQVENETKFRLAKLSLVTHQ